MSRRTYKPQSKKEDSANKNLWDKLLDLICEHETIIICTILGIIGVTCSIPFFSLLLLLPAFSVVKYLIIVPLIDLQIWYDRWHGKRFADTTKTQQRPEPAEETIRSRRNKGLAGVISLVMKADGVASKTELEGVVSYVKQHYKPADFVEIMEALKI